MKRHAVIIIMLISISIFSCDSFDLFRGNIFSDFDVPGFSQPPEENATIEEKQDYVSDVVDDAYGSTNFYNSLVEDLNSDDPEDVEKVEALIAAVDAVVEAGPDDDATPEEIVEFQEAALLKVDIDLVVSGGQEVSDNFVSSIATLAPGLIDGTVDTEDPEALVTDIITGAFNIDVDDPPSSEEFKEILEGFVAAASAYEALGETLTEATPLSGISDDLDTDNLALNAVVSSAIATISGEGAANSDTLLKLIIDDPDDPVTDAETETLFENISFDEGGSNEDMIASIVGEGIYSIVESSSLGDLLAGFSETDTDAEEGGLE